MKELFAQIAEYVPKANGWATLEKAQTIAALVLAVRPKVYLEIGVYAGRSFIPAALACKYLGHGHCIGIDPYDAQASADNENGANSEWWLKLNHEAILKEFQDNVNLFSLNNVVSLIRKKSDDAEIKDTIDILHLDGSHTEQALWDATKFAVKIRPGGYCIVDDVHWDSQGVSHAIKYMEDVLGFVNLYTVVKEAPDKNTPCDDWGLWVRTSC